MMRALVTGGTGFVGANLVRRLLADGHTVYLVVRPEHAAWRLKGIEDDVRLHVVDLADREGLGTLVRQVRPEWVFHLAAYGAYPTQTDLPRMIEVNVRGTANLVEACLETGFAAFVSTGSSSEYGLQDHAPAESERCEPNSHYAVTKLSATQLCRFTARSRGVHLPTLRLYSAFGPWEEPSRLMPTLIRHGLNGSLPSLVNPAVARDFVYVDDVCDAYLLAATTVTDELGPIYNVGTGVQTTLRDVVDAARRVLRIPQEPAWGSMPDRHWDTTTWVADSRKARDVLGWRPAFDVEEGFRKMVEWTQVLDTSLPAGVLVDSASRVTERSAAPADRPVTARRSSGRQAALRPKSQP